MNVLMNLAAMLAAVMRQTFTPPQMATAGGMAFEEDVSQNVGTGIGFRQTATNLVGRGKAWMNRSDGGSEVNAVNDYGATMANAASRSYTPSAACAPACSTAATLPAVSAAYNRRE